MVQDINFGGTDYSDQSLEDIRLDLEQWIILSNETYKTITERKNKLIENNYWNRIPLNFQAKIFSSLRCIKTFISDLEIIITAISNNTLSKQKIKILDNLGKKSFEYYKEYGRTFIEENHWKEYGVKNFIIVENIYTDARSYFGILFDANNMTHRLSHYINTPTSTINNFHQTINGNENFVTGINKGTITYNRFQNDQFSDEIRLAIKEIYEDSSIDENTKESIKELLLDAVKSNENGDTEIQSTLKDRMSWFLKGIKNHSPNLITILANYASIASYFNL